METKEDMNIIDKAFEEEREEREKYFSVECRRDFTHLPFVLFTVSHNHNQSTSVKFYSQKEIDDAIKVLQECDVFKDKK